MTVEALAISGAALDFVETARHGGRAIEHHDLYDDVGSQLYAELTESDRSEIGELVRALREVTGPILELASGSGRLCLPLVLAGHRLTAVDNSPRMNAILRHRLTTIPAAAAERCEVVEGDMSDFRFDRSFGAVILGSTSISLLDPTQRRAMFAAARRHFEPQASMWVTLSAPGFVDRDHDWAGRVVTAQSELHVFSTYRAGADTRSVMVARDDGSGPLVIATSTPRAVRWADAVADARRSGLVLADWQEMSEQSGPAERLARFVDEREIDEQEIDQR